MNTINTNMNIHLNREENHLNIPDSYLEIELYSTTNGVVRFADSDDIRLIS